MRGLTLSPGELQNIWTFDLSWVLVSVEGHECISIHAANIHISMLPVHIYIALLPRFSSHTSMLRLSSLSIISTSICRATAIPSIRRLQRMQWRSVGIQPTTWSDVKILTHACLNNNSTPWCLLSPLNSSLQSKQQHHSWMSMKSRPSSNGTPPLSHLCKSTCSFGMQYLKTLGYVSHHIWLRDHCRCSHCFEQSTKQRLVNTFEASPIFRKFELY